MRKQKAFYSLPFQVSAHKLHRSEKGLYLVTVQSGSKFKMKNVHHDKEALEYYENTTK